jgi:hypothetical protein
MNPKNHSIVQRKLLLALAPLLMVTLPAAAEDREWVPYKKFIETLHLDQFYGAPPEQRDKVKLAVKIQPENKKYKPSDLVLTVVHSGVREPLPINADGIVDLVPNPAWIKEEAVIYTNLPKGEKSSVTSSFEARLPDSLQIDYGYLMASVTQWNRLIKNYAGMLRFLAPTFTGVELHFSKAAHQSLQLMTKSGAKTYTADAKGDIALKLDETLLKENPLLVLSERPAEIGMSTD